MTDNDNRDFFLKEIDIIQSAINRMASNSFLIKGWTITLVVGVFLLKGTNMQIFIALIPIVMFWGLDAYFLYQERLFRARYKWVIENRQKSDDGLFDMDTSQFRQGVSIASTFRSKTLLMFYLTILIITMIYIVHIYLGRPW